MQGRARAVEQLLTQSQEEGHGAVADCYGVGDRLVEAAVVVVHEDVDDVLGGLLAARAPAVLLGVGEKVVVAGHDQTGGLGHGPDGVGVHLLARYLDAVGYLDEGRVEPAADIRDPAGQVLGEGRHDAAGAVAVLPGDAQHEVPDALGDPLELHGGGQLPGARDEIVEGGGHRARAEHPGARRLGAARHAEAEVDDVEVAGGRRTGVEPHVVEGEHPVIPDGEEEQVFLLAARGQPAAEFRGVGGDVPGPVDVIGEDAAGVQPVDDAPFDPGGLRVDGGFDRAVERRQSPAGERRAGGHLGS